MSDESNEIEERIAATQADLDTTLKERASAEQSIAEAESALAERRQALQTVLSREGTLRGMLGDLRKAREALKDDN